MSLMIAEPEVRSAVLYAPSLQGTPLMGKRAAEEDIGHGQAGVVHIERALRKRTGVADLLAGKGYRDELPPKLNLRLSSAQVQQSPAMMAFRISLARLILTVASAVSLGLATAAAIGVVALVGSGGSEGLWVLSAIAVVCVVLAVGLFWASNKKHIAAKHQKGHAVRFRHA